MNDAVLAVDFGTTNSLAGGWCDGKRVEALELDPFAIDSTLMRTLLYFPNSNSCYYGQQAIDEYINNEMEGRLFRSFKTHLANEYYLGTVIEDRILPLETMVGIFLLEMKKRAEKKFDCPIEKAIFGRPAKYSVDPVKNTYAIHRMEKAIEFAGFKKYAFVPEPLAAAFDYRRNLTAEKIILIGDFGGGTSDFTLIRVGPYAYAKEHVLGIDGCALAGDALDSLFMSQKLNQYFGAQTKYRYPLGKNILTMPPGIAERLNHPAHIVHLKEKETYEFIKEVRRCSLGEQGAKAIDRLCVLMDDQQVFSFFETIEKTKRQLSDEEGVTFSFDYPGIDIYESFSRGQFANWSKETNTKIFAALDSCMNQAQLKPEQVDLVCMTGGTAKVPIIRQELIRRFGEEKLQTQTHFHSVLSGLIESTQFWEF